MGLTVEKTNSQSVSFTLPTTKLIIGLGNMGDIYAKNRHNVGFMALDTIQPTGYGKWKEKARLKATVAEQTIDGVKIILAKPTTMMNLSGNCVKEIASFYKINAEDIVVIYDEADIDFGTVRQRTEGGSAGHNGIKSILSHVDEDMRRIRVGVANPVLKKQDTADFVLSNFNKEEVKKFDDLFTVIETSVNKFISGDFVDHSETI